MNSKKFEDQPVRITGQHFTRSQSLIQSMMRHAGIAKSDLVLDIGAGKGALTKPLSQKAGRVIAIERDSRLVSQLRSLFKTTPNVTITAKDARIAPLPARPFKVVANIPYTITTDIFGRLMDKPESGFRGGVIIMEWGAARRFINPVQPDPRILGWNTWFTLDNVQMVPPHAFSPPPKVSSAMLVIQKKQHPNVDPADVYRYMAFVGSLLSRPSEPIQHALRSLFSRTQMNRIQADTGLHPAAPVKTLTVDQWAHCFNTMMKLVPPRLHPGMPGKYKKLYR